MLKAKKILATIMLAGMALSPVLTLANSWTDRATEGGLGEIGTEAYGESPDDPTNIYSIVAGVVRVMLSLLGIIFVVLLIIAGFKYMTAGGDQDKIKEAVAQIRNAVIGLIIVITALSVTYFITAKVLPKVMKK